MLAASSADDDEELPITADGRARLGDKLLGQGQSGEALVHYREAVRIEDGTESRTRLGDAYAYGGQGLNAYRQYRRAIKMSSAMLRARSSPHVEPILDRVRQSRVDEILKSAVRASRKGGRST